MNLTTFYELPTAMLVTYYIGAGAEVGIGVRGTVRPSQDRGALVLRGTHRSPYPLLPLQDFFLDGGSVSIP